MNPYYSDDVVTLHHGDCLDVLRTLPDASVDAVVTDPPYGLDFMGKDWDNPARMVGQGNSIGNWKKRKGDEGYVSGNAAWYGRVDMRAFQTWCEAWAAECLRVLKPGGHMLAFGGSRTWHRLAAGVEDAGFEIRDSIAWLYGSGFPKSLDVSKAIDKARDDGDAIRGVTAFVAEARDRAGITNRQIDDHFGFNGMAGHWTNTKGPQAAVPRWEQWGALRDLLDFGDEMDAEVWRLNGRKGTPGEAWEQREVVGHSPHSAQRKAAGWLGAMGKPEGERLVTAAATDDAAKWEGWGTALKPAFEPVVVARKPLVSTVAGNVLAYGTGALNIDASRTANADGEEFRAPQSNPENRKGEVGRAFQAAGDAERNHAAQQASTERLASMGRWPSNVVLDESQAAELDRQSGTLTSGANPTRRGADGDRTAYGAFGGQADAKPARGADSGGASRFFPTFRYEAKAPTSERPKAGEVQHPTVKPLDLMRWLVRLVTPPGGVVLEPFAGSGTTVEAAVLEGFSCIAIEREAEYLPLIEQRLSKPLQQSLFDDMEGVA